MKAKALQGLKHAVQLQQKNIRHLTCHLLGVGRGWGEQVPASNLSFLEHMLLMLAIKVESLLAHSANI